jgi:hypothetical protein
MARHRSSPARASRSSCEAARVRSSKPTVPSRWHRWARRTNSIAGAHSAGRVIKTAATCRATSWARRTWPTMATGATIRSTAMSGIRRRSRPTGRRIAMGAGCGSHPGAGPGWIARRGDMRPFITAAGPICETAGPGCPRRRVGAQSTPRRWWPGWAARVPPRSAGCPWLPARSTCPASASARANHGYIASVYQNPALQPRYANREVPGALSVVAQASFTSGRPVAPRLIAPPPQWLTATAMARPPAIAPAAGSALAPGAQTPVKRPPLAILDRPVLARREAPPTPPHRSSAPHATLVAPAALITPAMPVTTATPVAPATPAPSPSTPIDRRAIRGISTVETIAAARAAAGRAGIAGRTAT